jgi:GTP-binding protein HflX
MPRLVGKGIILSQQGAGIGTSGPGEKKLETDRRRIRKSIESLQKGLGDIRRHREVMRKRRQGNEVPSIALVGYTNAGKSTLLNTLTHAGTQVHDGMFTTLDPLSKILQLPNGEHAVISDTVGFLHGLPHHLIEAFKATLEEVVQSDLLIHVLDVSHPMARQRYDSVMGVLAELGVCGEEDAKPVITVMNKIDLVEMDKLLLREVSGEFANAIAVSAKSGENVDVLLKMISGFFSERFSTVEVKLPNTRMDLVNMLYEQGKVIDVQYNQKTVKVKLTLAKPLLEKLASYRDIQIC